MAKKSYFGDEADKAQKTKKAYIGDVSDISRKIKKMYMGDANNIARCFFSSNAAEGSNVIMYGSGKKFYVNNNKNYLIGIDKLSLYADGSGLDGFTSGYVGQRVSAKGNYIYSNPGSGDSTSINFYRLEEGSITLFDTLQESKFPSGSIRSGSGYGALYLRGVCMSYDEQTVFVASHNENKNTSPNYTDYFYVSSFTVGENGLTHVSTQLVTSTSYLYFTLRGFFVAAAESAPYVAACMTFNAHNSGDPDTEYRRVIRYKVNDDKTLTSGISSGSVTNTAGSQSLSDYNRQGEIEISANGKWLAVYHAISADVYQGSAYLYYCATDTSMTSKDSVWYYQNFGGFRMSRNRLISYSTVYSTSADTGMLSIRLLNDDGTITINNITIQRSLLSAVSYSLFGIRTKISRDGTVLIVGSSRTKLVCKLNYSNNTFAVTETVTYADDNYRYVDIINE